MQRTLRALAKLMDYPNEALKTHIGEIRTGMETETPETASASTLLDPLLEKITRKPLLDLQIDYSELFDGSRGLSLHLFEHIHGDSRDRGPAMIDLGDQYVAHGFFMVGSELPDFIPAFLEFCSCLPEHEARDWLCQPAHVFAALAQRLDQRNSEYATLFHAVILLAGETPSADAVRELQTRQSAHEMETVDDSWEEQPVTFAPGGPKSPLDSVVSGLKAAGKLIASTRNH